MSNQTIERSVDTLKSLEAAASARNLDLGLLVQVYCARRLSDSLDSIGSDLSSIETALSAG